MSLKRKRMMAAYSNNAACRYIYEANPYLDAERKFLSGTITVAQAVAMMCLDRDFVAECELQGKDKAVYADAIVRQKWAAVMLEAQALRRAS
jgi:hypothetical protein